MSFFAQIRQIDFAEVRRQITWRDVRNAAFGLTTVFGGLGLAGLTYAAHLSGNPQLAGYAAMASLGFVVLILIFVVPPLARSASREVAQIDLPLELTTGGLILGGLMAIVGFAAWNTGNNLLFIVLALLLSTLIIALITAEFNLRNLEVKVRLPELVFIGEPLDLEISLKNRKYILPAISIVVAVRGRLEEPSFSQIPKIKFEVPKRWEKFVKKPLINLIIGYFIYTSRRETIDLDTVLTFPQRGRFIVKSLELSTKFPFGFWKRRQRLKIAETEIFVVPKPENVRDRLDLRSFKIGQMTSRRRGSGQDLYALREYQPSDESRHIDWKATARTRKLIVREFTAEDERRVNIIFDNRLPRTKPEKPIRQSWFRSAKKDAPKDEIKERFECGITLAVSLVAFFVTEKSEVRLITTGEIGDFGASQVHYQQCLRRFTKIEPHFFSNEREFSGGFLPLEKLEEIVSGENITIIVSPSENETISSANQNLQIISY